MTATPSSLVRSNLFLKTNDTLSSVARNTSCSRGWLHLVVQVTFGAITVASFILIMLMTFQSSPNSHSACKTVNCRITCSDRFYSEGEIIAAILAADSDCGLKLTLRNPSFQNGVMPENWLDKVPYFIETLSIVGGNLQHIANNAFMTQFASHLKTLMLENITISNWTSDTLIGLSELNFLRIRNCQLKTIRQDALRAVDNTIKTLTITGSGIWNPSHVTGSVTGQRITNNLTKLTVVNFSSNTFGNILGASSFTGLESCKDLYLNSCGITAIGEGAFDPLKSIEMLFLNNNFLITLPSGLFSNTLQIHSKTKPRINLQNNFWHCDCLQNEIMQLSRQGFLLVDPTCYHPMSFSGKPVSGLEEFCDNRTKTETENYYVDRQANLDYDMKKECYYGKKPLNHLSLQVVSPSALFKCPVTYVTNLDRNSRNEYLEHGVETVSNISWLRPAFLLRHNNLSMMQIASNMNDSLGYGLLFYQSECPNELYCFNILPSVLRLYDINSAAKYTFCPLNLYRARVEIDKCINYDVSEVQSHQQQYLKYTRPLMYAITGLFCLLFGAVLVYSIIRINPYLLKGSKRLLFVKHRDVDALVLPPKIPLRTSLSNSKEVLVSGCQKVYTVSDDTKLLYPCHLIRSNSVRSDKSSSPTYISAMQPTEAQLAEWRLRHHFDKNVSLTSITSEAAIYSWVCDNDMNSTNVPYENFK